MNDMFFPPPVGVICTTGLSPRTTALMASLWPGRNLTVLPLRHSNMADISTCRNASNLRNCTLCRLLSNLFPPPLPMRGGYGLALYAAPASAFLAEIENLMPFPADLAELPPHQRRAAQPLLHLACVYDARHVRCVRGL
ncbi:hypothetical protein TGAMA5MH_04937 [Trichoderma gamsii]|uniref:Uncharacterized protein n=1 Tax=Trichoderma gamsii TaxID=398673 RepID=A0A2K0TCJ6_9HYPO|nr:hypothetical protein TGAMA5MH_04937 [Trichoderma gamsii]